MVVVGEVQAIGGEQLCGELGEAVGVGLHFHRREPTSRGHGDVERRLRHHRAAFAIDHYLRAQRLEQRRVRGDFLQLGRYVAFGEKARIPAGSQRQVMARKDRTEHLRLAREFAAELDANIARCGRFGQALFERRVVAELLQYVVRPRQGADGNTELRCDPRGFFLSHVCLLCLI